MSGPDTWTGTIPVRVRVRPPFNGRRDLDNTLKACGDVLVSSGMLASDRMGTIQEITAEAGAKEQTGCIVTISRIAPERASIGAV